MDKHHNHGFTMIELVAVIIVLGILAAFVAPHFLGTSRFDTRGTYDNLVSALRYAQKRAIASNCPVRISINTHGYALKRRGLPCASGSFSHPVIKPGGGDYLVATASDVSLSPNNTTITFTPSGATSTTGDTTIMVAGSGVTQTLTVIAGTGYVKTR